MFEHSAYRLRPRDRQKLMHEKTCDPYSGLSILMHGVISVPDATFNKTRGPLGRSPMNECL